MDSNGCFSVILFVENVLLNIEKLENTVSSQKSYKCVIPQPMASNFCLLSFSLSLNNSL